MGKKEIGYMDERLNKQLDIAVIAEITGLSTAEIEKL